MLGELGQLQVSSGVLNHVLLKKAWRVYYVVLWYLLGHFKRMLCRFTWDGLLFTPNDNIRTSSERPGIEILDIPKCQLEESQPVISP